jgi:hypothetical protein
MGADHFCDKWIKPTHQFASRVVIMGEYSSHKFASIKIIHVASTPLVKTAERSERLHFLMARSTSKRSTKKIVTAEAFLRS